MKIILSNMIVIHNPNKHLLNWCKSTLVIKNPEYQKKVQLGYYVGKTPKNIYLYHYDFYEDILQLPSGCLSSIKQFIDEKDAVVDLRTAPTANIKSNIVLRNYQKPSEYICRHQDSGLIISFCGSGKTQMALALAAKMGLKTLFITHTQDLVQQAYDRCEECLECTKSYIKEGKVDYSGDITFALVQTLVKKLDKVPQNEFGLVIVDECFPSGTLINTPNGKMKIEDLKIGDKVYSFNHDKSIVEIKEINYLFDKEVDELLNIQLENGKTIVCTKNHPIYTNKGYIKAEDIIGGDCVYEMYNVWEGNKKRKFYGCSMVGQDVENAKNREGILFKRMWSQSIERLFSKLCSWGNCYRKNENEQPDEEYGNEKKDGEYTTIYKSPSKNKRWKRNGNDDTTTKFIQRNEKIQYCFGTRVCGRYWYEKREWLSNELQNRFGISEIANRNRDRWSFSLFNKKKRTRFEETRFIRAIRVENISIQKQRSDGQFESNSNGIKVYNIGVKDNNNYFADDILVHNCHRTAVNATSIGMFRECIEYFAAKHKVGLSATLSRSDGLEYCIPYIIGDIVYEIKEDNENNQYVGVFEGEEIIRFDKGLFQTPVMVHPIQTDYSLIDKKGAYKNVFDRNGMTISFSKLISDIACDNERNDMIADLVNGLSGSTIILSDRVGQLEYLKDKIKDSVEIDGNTKKDVREQAINDVKSGKKKVLLASYKIAKEGLDCKILQNVVFATPVKDYSVVVQCIGRCQRPYEGKDIAHVYDLIDDVKNLTRFWTQRKQIYKKMNYSLKEIDYINK